MKCVGAQRVCRRLREKVSSREVAVNPNGAEDKNSSNLYVVAWSLLMAVFQLTNAAVSRLVSFAVTYSRCWKVKGVTLEAPVTTTPT